MAFGFLLCLSCATAAPTSGRPPHTTDLSTIDVVDADGTSFSLDRYRGQVVVLDVCSASVDGCLINANMVADACQEACSEDVVMISMLLEDEVFAPQALKSYKNILKVSQEVVIAGPISLSGSSVLGRLAVPQLLLFGRDGNIREGVAGATVSAVGIIKRVNELTVE